MIDIVYTVYGNFLHIFFFLSFYLIEAYPYIYIYNWTETYYLLINEIEKVVDGKEHILDDDLWCAEISHDRVKKSTLAAKRLKFLAGNTQNINESKINLDS